MHFTRTVAGMAATPDGKGYWLVAKDGGVFAFGDATFYGSEASKPWLTPSSVWLSARFGLGYWLARCGRASHRLRVGALRGPSGKVSSASVVAIVS